jgi:hypothetical protein
MPIRVCKICSTDFYAKPNHIKKGWGKYCSPACQHIGRKNGKHVMCFICKKEVYRKLQALKRSKSQKYFCSKSCQTIWRNQEFVGSKHANWKHGKASYKSVLSRHHIPQKCVLCKTVDSRVLAVHHIDENHYNNNLSNLSWLCHNCHHLVHHDSVEKQKFLNIVKETLGIW